MFFVVFSTNFITGFPWQRVDNVTKFQLFAEQLPLLSNSLSPYPPPTLSLYSTDSNYLLSFGLRLRLRLEPKQKPQRDVPQNSTAKLHQLARRIDAPRGRRLCGSMQSPPLSLSAYICPPPLSRGNPSAKRATTHIVYYYPLTANANRIRFNMLPNHNKLCT